MDSCYSIQYQKSATGYFHYYTHIPYNSEDLCYMTWHSCNTEFDNFVDLNVKKKKSDFTEFKSTSFCCKSILWSISNKYYTKLWWSLRTTKFSIITFILGTWTTSPYWSFVCTVITVGQPQRISSLFKISDVFWGSAYESGWSHLQQRQTH